MAAGAAAAAVALGVTQLAASFFSPAADARTAVGTSVINLTPGPVKEWAIQTFGTNDKTFLTVMVVLVITALIAVAAIWERARIGTLALLGAGLAGALAVLNQPGGGVVDLIPVALGTACGIATLRLLNRQPEAETTADDVAAQADPARRRSLLTLVLLGFGALSGVGGSILTRQRRSVAGDREAYTLPKIASPAPPIPPGSPAIGADG